MQERRYVRRLDELARESPVVILNRVSGPSQHRQRQAYAARIAIAIADLVEVGHRAFTCKGHGPQWERMIREVVALAIRENASILVAETNRVIRSPSIGDAWDATPSISQIAEFLRLTHGVIVASVLPPDTPPNIVRTVQISQGKFVSRWDRAKVDNSPGYKRRLRDVLKPEAIRLRSLGLSYQQIADLLDRERSTISGWTAKVEQLGPDAVRNFAALSWLEERCFREGFADFTSVRIVPERWSDDQ